MREFIRIFLVIFYILFGSYLPTLFNDLFYKFIIYFVYFSGCVVIGYTWENQND